MMIEMSQSTISLVIIKWEKIALKTNGLLAFFYFVYFVVVVFVNSVAKIFELAL